MPHEMTAQEATDEAVLLFVRKIRRLHPEAYADVIGKLSAGARDALNLADVRADRMRDLHPEGLTYPAEPELTEDDV